MGICSQWVIDWTRSPIAHYIQLPVLMLLPSFIPRWRYNACVRLHCLFVGEPTVTGSKKPDKPDFVDRFLFWRRCALRVAWIFRCLDLTDCCLCPTGIAVFETCMSMEYQQCVKWSPSLETTWDDNMSGNFFTLEGGKHLFIDVACMQPAWIPSCNWAAWEDLRKWMWNRRDPHFHLTSEPECESHHWS